jgi:hypothetical protein
LFAADNRLRRPAMMLMTQQVRFCASRSVPATSPARNSCCFSRKGKRLHRRFTSRLPARPHACRTYYLHVRIVCQDALHIDRAAQRVVCPLRLATHQDPHLACQFEGRTASNCGAVPFRPVQSRQVLAVCLPLPIAYCGGAASIAHCTCVMQARRRQEASTW